MRKWKSLLAVFIMLFVFSGIAYGTNSEVIEVIINREEMTVPKASINKDGKNIDIGIPSFINSDRTLVPVRLAEKLGAEITWNGKTKAVGVKHDGKEIKLTIDSDKAIIGSESKRLDDKSIPRLVLFENGDARTMVPVSFISEELGYKVDWDGRTRTVLITSEKAIEPAKAFNKVTNVSNELVNGKEAIVIRGTKNSKYKIINLKNPERIVVDLLDSTLQGPDFQKFEYALGFVQGVRVARFTPDGNYNPDDKIVRVVLDTKDGAVNPEIEIQENDDSIVIVPQKNIWKNINYEVQGVGRLLTINNYMDTNYSVDYDNEKNIMEITIPKEAVNLTEGSAGIKDELVEDIEIVETSKDMKVVVRFTKEMEYKLTSKDRDSKVILRINEKSSEKPSRKEDKVEENKDEEIVEIEKPKETPTRKPGQRLIVIDPGHGGKDSGAVSPNGVKEKDLVLKVSAKLDDALKEKGYSTIMTRETDVFIELRDRSKIGNEAFADIFISMHANAHSNKAAHGMEVLYNKNHDIANKTKNEQRLAKLILDEMVKDTGANNRGIVNRPNLSVLRNTKMPASLVEIGFMSNANEEKLILDDEYQNTIVDAIVNGVEKYFND